MKPLGNRVVVEVLEVEATSKGGIVLTPSTERERNYKRGKVLAIGTGRLLESGQVMPNRVSEGDTVLFNKHAGIEVTHEGKTLRVLDEGELLAQL